MAELRLVEPSIELKEAYLHYIMEWENTGEKIVPFATRRDGKSYGDLLENWEEGKTDVVFEKGFVPATLYFMINESNKIIGAIHYRHQLNDKLLFSGGHLGYGIRPSERQKGYGTVMLTMTLKILKEIGHDQVLITCDQVNSASAKTIESNNGVLENIVDEDGELVKRYWITL